MALPLDENEAVDFDKPLNTSPDYTATHIFSTNDITGTFEGLTQGDVLPGQTPVIDFTATPKVTKDGVDLYPINSEFGFIVTDFDGAIEKDFEANPEYAEGWAGDLKDAEGNQIGVVVSDSPTDTLKTPAKLGTWLAGIGGNTVKASTEHYTVMQNVLSDQLYPGDPNAAYPLDDNLRVVGGTYDGQLVADVIPIVGDVNGDGVQDIKDVLEPNESTITENIAVSDDYSVTLKDDGKLLYRWGNTVKRPNDIRMEAEIPLPDEWKQADDAKPHLMPLYKVTAAELVVQHTITNNPNDQIRPEDYENEAAIGRLPSYTELPDGKWVTTADYYAGDGTFYPAGTVLKDPALAAAVVGGTLDQIGALSEDLKEGFTNAYYTILDREPFEPVLNGAGDDYEVGPRWRLQADKYGQDLPGVEIPIDPSEPPPPTQDEVKYEVGANTQTVINLLDWEGISPLSISAGWQNNSGTTTANGLNMTNNFDVAFYVKGDQKPATIYGTELVLSYDEVPIADVGAAITGTAEDDVLAGEGGNTFTGLAGEDLFVLAYGNRIPASIVESTINDYEDGVDKIGLIGLGVNDLNFDTVITQQVVGGNLEIDLNGIDLVTLVGITEELDLDDFHLMTQDYVPPTGETIVGTDGNDYLIGTPGSDLIFGGLGDDRILGIGGNDTIFGGDGVDYINGGLDNDRIVGGEGDDSWLGGDQGIDYITGGLGNDRMDGGDGDDKWLGGEEGADYITGGLGNDRIDGGADNDRWLGGDDGDDYITGGIGDDRIEGGAGNDRWLGGDDGADYINGGLGNDRIDGGAGNDRWLGGGDGVDYITGGLGNDRLDGGADNDTLIGGPGADVMTGGLGDDKFVFAASDFAAGVYDTVGFSTVAGDFDYLQLAGSATDYNFIDHAGYVEVQHIATGGGINVWGVDAATLTGAHVQYFV